VSLRRWLTPGIGIKRWLLVVFAGLVLLALAAAHVIRQATLGLPPGGLAQTVLDLVTFQFLPYPVRGLLVGLAGGGLVVFGGVRLVRAVMEPFFHHGEGDPPLVEVIYQKRFLARGPRIVAIGGGTGLSSLLRGLKEHTSNLTAIVTVADDGGSSGVLRTELGIPPVGDIRNCIAALADAEPLMHELLQYRFGTAAVAATGRAGEPAPPATLDPPAPPSGLAGHAVGNLLIAALTAIEGGDFEEGVRQMNRVLAVRGRVLPVSATPLTLHARLADGRLVEGQSRIARESGIERVWLEPAGVSASADALAAIADADVIVLGPGSLFTSLLPALLVGDIRDAIAASSALRLYVCNVATQTGETSGFDLAAHVDMLQGHTTPGIVDVVLANNQFAARGRPGWSAEPVQLRWPGAGETIPRLVLDDVVDPDNAHHHDSARLAAAILRIVEHEGGRMRNGSIRAAARSARSA
jgi:uncharacterized cofD-like protein